MKIVRNTKKFKRIEDFYPGEVFQDPLNNQLYMKVDDAEVERDEPDTEAAVNLESGELVYFEFIVEFIPVNCKIVLEE